jgi:hypothetical protein
MVVKCGLWRKHKLQVFENKMIRSKIRGFHGGGGDDLGLGIVRTG